jgi:hypothetical protein
MRAEKLFYKLWKKFGVKRGVGSLFDANPGL